MRATAFSRLCGLLLCLMLSRCSLSLEDPEADARKNLAKVIPTTMEDLVGRWKADSTYTVEDTRATRLADRGVWLEIFADTSFSRVDTTGLAFPGKADGVYYLNGDTLIVFPAAAAPDTFLVRLRFLGNYLELSHPADQRYSFFHKLKPMDSTTLRDTLAGALWRMQGRRLSPGVFRPEPLVRDFTYLRFSGDSMHSDIRLNGVIRVDSGILERSGFAWTWKAAGGTRGFLADLVDEDSLRMWPLTEGRPDSGFFLYARAAKHHARDLDMRRLMGHMRCDTMRYLGKVVENHYGRYYDWTFTEDHKVAVETNMPDLPAFQAWTLDSGYLSLDAPGLKGLRFRVDTSGGRVALSPDSGKVFGKDARFIQTKVDPARFLGKPLQRFDQASYLELAVSGDTVDYFFEVNHIADRFEIARGTGDSALWASLVIKPQETFQSSQAGFFFAFQGRDRKHGRYACASRPGTDMVIRLTDLSDPLMAQGLVQGTCRILSADSASADSTLGLEGSFRLKRKTNQALRSPLWSLP